MTRILKRGQKTYFKEDVVACLADETMQKIFTQSEYGNRTVWMEELQEEAKERFNMDFTDEDYEIFKSLIAKDEYLLSLDDNAGILESKALDIVVGYGRVKGGVSGLWEKEQAEYDQKEQLYADLLKKYPMKYDAKAECLWLPDGTKVNNVLSPLQAEYYHDNYLYHEALVTGDTDDIITNLEDYKSACAGGDLEQYDKIQKLLDDVLQFEKSVDSNYVKRFDPHYAISISAVRDLLVKGTVIQCNHMRDPSHPVPDGTRGVVEKVDDAGLVHVKWENGSGLNLDPLVDDFEVIEDELDLGENQQEDEMEL